MTQPTDDQQPTAPQSPGQAAYPPPADPFASAAVTPPTAPQPAVPLPPAAPATPVTPPAPPAPVEQAPVPVVPVSGAPTPVSGTPAPGFTTPTAAYPTSGQPVYPAPGQPAYAAPGQPGYPTAPYPGAPGFPPAPVKKSKAPLIIGIVLGVLLLLCGGGITAYVLLTRNTEGVGAASAKDATTSFLTAVYKDGDAAAAEKLVCGDARDRKEIDAKIAEIKAETAALKGAEFTWETPKISGESANEATAEVTIKLVTSDEKMSEQPLTLILVKHEGWFVCEVK